MKKGSFTIPLLTAAGLAGATTTTATWPDESILSIVVPPDSNHLTAKDPAPCYTEDLASYFDVPLGPHSMVMAQISYAQAVLDPACSTLPTWSSHYHELCPPLDKAAWCRFPAAPEAAGVLPAYSAYGSAASAWWRAHSAPAVAAARRCPYNWWRAAWDVDVERSRYDQYAMGFGLLNETLMFAQCYAEAHPTASGEPATTPLATPGPEARPGSGTAPAAAATGSATLPQNGGRARADAVGVGMFWGLAAAAVMAVW